MLGKLIDLIEPFASIKRKDDPLAEPWDELTEGQATLAADNEAFAAEVAARVARWARTVRDNTRFAEARMALHPLADRCRDLTKQIDLAAKLAGRVIDFSVKELDARDSAMGERRGHTGAEGAGGGAGGCGRGAAPGALLRAAGRLASGTVPRGAATRCRRAGETGRSGRHQGA